MRGSVRLEIDPMGLEAKAVLTPDPSGVEVSPATVKTLLAERGVREGISLEEIEKSFRTSLRKGESVSFIAARGTPPVAGELEACEWEPLSLPKSLQETAERVLSKAKPPEIFRVHIEKVKADPKGKKQGLSLFGRSREEKPVWETRTVREPAVVDAAVAGKGYAYKGAVVARVKSGTPGRDGRSVYGKPVRIPRIGKGGILLGANLERNAGEVTASVSGFLRKGADWCDLVPFRANEIVLSVDGATCMLSFTPGDKEAPPPEVALVFEQAAALGFSRDSLLPETEIAKIVGNAFAAKKAVVKQAISPSVDSLISVTVSPDRLRATLSLRKGRGTGRKLNLSEIGDAIKKSGVKAYKADIVKRDLLNFYNGTRFELPDYTLAVGEYAEPGEDGRIEILLDFLKKEAAEEIARRSEDNPSGLEGIQSLAEFPLAAVENMGRVKEGTEILRIHPAGLGKPGLDVMNAVVPAGKGKEPRLKTFENLKMRKDILVSATEGIVEMGAVNGVTFVRARPHVDGELRITVSDDRMKGFLSFIPAQGTGRIADYEEVRSIVEKEGIIQGLQSDALLKALNAISRNLSIRELCIAVGKPVRGSEGRKPVFHVPIASGKRVALLEDGRVDFKNQDTITQVSKGALLATLPAPGKGVEDGWDVTGKVIQAIDKLEAGLQAGKNIRIEEQNDGSTKYFADADGELFHVEGVLEVKVLHTVPGNVDLATGNVKFKGKVHVKGSVLSGFSVMSGDDTVINEVVQAALVSSNGSIWVGHGIKGEGKAILRARGDILASFAEQAVLISMGDIRLNSGCIRCQVKCSGRLILESDKGILMGGTVKVKHGATVHNLGSAGGARTEVSFGQDYVVQDQIERELKEMDVIKHRLAELDARMKRLERSGSSMRRELEEARMAKLEDLRDLEARKARVLGLRDKLEEHFPSELTVRGTLYPGAIVESHGRLYHVKEERTHIALYFDASQGRILEKAAR